MYYLLHSPPYDEFILLIEGTNTTQIEPLAQRILSMIVQPVELSHEPIVFGNTSSLMVMNSIGFYEE